MSSAIVTKKGQITIPKKVRVTLGLRAGDRIDFLASARGVFEIFAASINVSELKGLIARPPESVSTTDIRKAVARRTIG